MKEGAGSTPAARTLKRSAGAAYAAAYAELDAGRRVLACKTCGETVKWSGVADAVVKGWAYEDVVVAGRRSRSWRCPRCKPSEALPPAPPPRASAPVSAADIRRSTIARAFDQVELAVVQLGQQAGKQLAVVLDRMPNGDVIVVGWIASSARWTGAKTVPRSKVTLYGTIKSFQAKPLERLRRAAARAWPPALGKNRRSRP